MTNMQQRFIKALEAYNKATSELFDAWNDVGNESDELPNDPVNTIIKNNFDYYPFPDEDFEHITHQINVWTTEVVKDLTKYDEAVPALPADSPEWTKSLNGLGKKIYVWVKKEFNNPAYHQTITEELLESFWQLEHAYRGTPLTPFQKKALSEIFNIDI